jgi:transposase
MQIAVLGIDLGKNSCSVAGLDMNGAVVLRRKMTREILITFASKLPVCMVAMEARCGAHFLGRTFAAQGHTVRLMSPEYVQPYVKSRKTDDRDAEAIAEAATRPTMRFVTLKSEAQRKRQRSPALLYADRVGFGSVGLKFHGSSASSALLLWPFAMRSMTAAM